MSPAPLGRRIGAWAIDLLITVIVPFALYLMIALVAFSDDVPLGVGLALVAVLLLFHLLYAPTLLARSGPAAGQTLGKRALGVRAARSDGGTISFGRALRREVLGRSLLGLVPLYTAIDLLWPLSNGPRRAVHDLIADTVVVEA